MAEESEVSVLMSSVMGSLADIQNQIRKQQLDQALHALLALESKYPNIKFLEFTRASIRLLQGHREEAKHIAEAALTAVPNYQEGQRFLHSLGETR
jgi:predicted Zn-dependent protease